VSRAHAQDRAQTSTGPHGNRTNTNLRVALDHAQDPSPKLGQIPTLAKNLFRFHQKVATKSHRNMTRTTTRKVGGVSKSKINWKLYDKLLEYGLLRFSMSNLGVNNTSQSILTPQQTTLLSKGLKFIPTPTINHSTIPKTIFSFKEMIRRIKLKFHFKGSKDNKDFDPKFHIKSSFTPVHDELDNITDQLETKFKEFVLSKSNLAQTNKTNLTLEERNEIESLRNSDTLMVQATDKNLGLILLSKEWYQSECERQLSDTSVYTKLEKDQVLGKLADLQSHCSLICKSLKFIPYHLKKYLIETFEGKKATQEFKFCIFYILPKIHKSGPIKGRPICSNTGFVTHALSAVVDRILQPYVQKTATYIKDSFSLVQRVANLTIPADQEVTLFAFDVVSLYPSIPIDEALERIKDFLLSQATSIEERLLITDTHKLLSFVMKNNYLMFNSEVYHQIQGTCMGTPAAVVFACLFMAQLEQQWIDKFNSKLLLFNRFIDDGFGLFLGNEEETKLALEAYNSLHPNIKIEISVSQSSIPFLDLNLYIDPQNPTRLQVSCFQKEMNKYLYLPFTSYHDDKLKANFIRGELIRYLRNSTEEHNFVKLKNAFFSRLRSRGYPAEFLVPIFLSIHFSDRPRFMQTKSETLSFSETQPILVLEKNPLTQSLPIKRFLQQNWFKTIIPPEKQSDVSNFLRSLSTPTILTKYPPNIRNLLIRSEFNGFKPKPKHFWRSLNQPKHMLNPMEIYFGPNSKRFKNQHIPCSILVHEIDERPPAKRSKPQQFL